MRDLPDTLAGCAEAVLRTADAREKTALSRACAAKWRESVAAGAPLPLGSANPPDSPARPTRPELLDPRDVPRRRPGSPEGRIAILHAIAHIELNAVDLHWDILARFTDVPMPPGFCDDWVRAADEESKHFNLIADRLEALGSHYGALPAHAGMWRAAAETAHDLEARLAIVPMVLEARGLDVTPGMIEIFQKASDAESVSALKVIYAEEVGHVAYGSKWFHFLCGRHERDPRDAFHDMVRTYFHGGLKAPFNDEKRAEAGLPLDFYWPLAQGGPNVGLRESR
ncbi:MAG: ferritin-like domain-containing protein [Pseudomonadota bacterium]